MISGNANAGSVLVGFNTSVAPTCLAIASDCSRGSIAMTVAPAFLKTCNVASPTTPHPIIAALESVVILAFSTACTATLVGSARGASSLVTLAGSGIHRSAGHTPYSASPPSSVNPKFRPLSHSCDVSLRQKKQAPQVRTFSMATLVPT